MDIRLWHWASPNCVYKVQNSEESQVGMLLLSNIMTGVTVPCDRWICSVYLCFYFPDSLVVHRGMKYDFRPTKSYPLSAAMTGTRCHFPCFPDCFISVSICVRIYGFVSAKIKLFHCTMSVNSQISHHSDLGMCPHWNESQRELYIALHTPW